MSYEDDRTKQIRLGQALNMAWQYALFTPGANSPEDAAGLAQEVVPIALSLIEAVQDGAVNTLAETTAAKAVTDAFPGAEIIPFQNPQSSTSTQPPVPGGGVERAVDVDDRRQPAPVPGASSGHKDDAKWQEYFADPTAWYDNRTSKRSPGAADFAHKAKKNDRGYPEGLWLRGKFGNAPAWVFDRLGVAR